MKAMILAAGEGRRLRPLTDTMPKPLLRVGKHCLIEYHLLQLKKIGISDVVINVSYMAKQIMDYLGNGKRYGINIIYSFEKSILGTGGGIKQALALLGDEAFLLVSADIWTEYTYPQSMLYSSSDIHLLLVDNPDFHPDGDYSLDAQGYLATTGQRYNYGGIAKIHPKVFDEINEDKFSFSPLVDRAIMGRNATGELFHGAWFNVGTREELDKLTEFLKSPI